jgi:hypothetical protein
LVPFLILHARHLALTVFLQARTSTHAAHDARRRFEACGALCKGCAYVRLKDSDVRSEHKTPGLSEIYVLYTGTAFFRVRRMIVQVATK